MCRNILAARDNKRLMAVHTGLLAVGSHLKLHDDELPSLPIVSAATESLPDPFAELHASSPGLAGAQQVAQARSGCDGTDEPLPEPETTDNHGGFDASFYVNEDPRIESTFPDVSADSTLGTATDVPHPPPQIQHPPQESVAGSLGSRQESPLVPPAAEHNSSTPGAAAERLLAGVMPHYDSGMHGLNRFLRLVNRDGKKKR